MIERLIDLCIRHRAIVLLLTAFLVAGGIWSARNIAVDALPDLSDVQVIIRTEYPGQAPQIVEDQVTYPLTTAMLSVPHAKVVRGYSMFGTSFVYVIFEDGTDMYWARSRVLEQLSFVGGKLPPGVSPELGPDATGVGWVFEYVLVTGQWCPSHPQGAWHDPKEDRWYERPSDAPNEGARERLVHHRIFSEPRKAWHDPVDNRRYDELELIPTQARDRVRDVELTRGVERCPIDGSPLLRSDLDLSDLRGLQDWYLRYELTALEGVSEVAALGGFVKQYQIVVDPVELRAYGISLREVEEAIARSNLDAGGRLIEMSETELMVRGLGYLGTLSPSELEAARAEGRVEEIRTERVLDELKTVALGANEDGSPIWLTDVAQIRVGPEIRRGVAEWNGEGEVAGGIVVMRYGENARETIARVRDRLAELERGLPPGVAIEVAYDRSDLIDRAIATLSNTLIEEMTVVSLILLLFLLHARSTLVAIFVLPTGVLASLVIMHLLGINANIMSLGGIAIAIGVMVDSAVIMVENAHKHLEAEAERVRLGFAPRRRSEVVAEAAREVGPSLFFSLLVITVSFLPVFVLGEQSGRLFKPLAFTKTFAMGAAAILAVTVVPVLMVYFISERVVPRTQSRTRAALLFAAIAAGPAILLAFMPLPQLEDARWWLVGGWVVLVSAILLPQRILPEDRNPLSRFLERIYTPAFVFSMERRWLVLGVALVVLVATIWPWSRLGSEFMPPLEEGDLLYMPTTDPGISINKARELLQQTDKIIASFPEVDTVLGKIGRAETATDPAPPSMLETTIVLHRDKSRWRRVPVDRFFSGWPSWLRKPLAKIFPESRPITTQELVEGYHLPGGLDVPGLDSALQIPGLVNSWTMPIRTRIDMLSTGIRTPVGVKVLGSDLRVLSDVADRIAQVLKTAEGTGAYTLSAFPEKSVGGNYLDIEIDRASIARYALTVADVQQVITSATGGRNVTSTVEGLERYPVNVRYPHELRDDLDALRQTLVATPSGAQVPLGQLAELHIRKGPPMVKSENARLTSWVYVSIAGIDLGTYVENARRAVESQVELPPGTSIVWSGQYEYMQAANERLMIAVPLAGIAIVFLLYVATRNWVRVAMIFFAVPFSVVGAIWLLYFLDYDLSLAVWVGIIALAGLDAETGLVMLLYLDQSFDRFRAEGRMRDTNDLWHAVHEGAVKRIRPKTMTVVTSFIGLLPLMWATGAGADTMRRLAAPMLGGLFTSFLIELFVYPALFYSVKRVALRRERALGEARPAL